LLTSANSRRCAFLLMRSFMLSVVVVLVVAIQSTNRMLELAGCYPTSWKLVAPWICEGSGSHG
jgi:hypothetical protein